MEAWTANAEKEEESFLKILHTRMEISSAHGLPNIQRSSRPLAKLFWLALFLTGIGVITWQVVTLFQTYFSFNYTVSLEIKFNRSQTFPAVTICNMNPVKKSKLEKADDSFRELFDVNFVKPPLFGSMDMMGVGGQSGMDMMDVGGQSGMDMMMDGGQSGIGAMDGGENNGGGGDMTMDGGPGTMDTEDNIATQHTGNATSDMSLGASGNEGPSMNAGGPSSDQGQSGGSATTLTSSSTSMAFPTGTTLGNGSVNSSGAGATNENGTLTPITTMATENTTEILESWEHRQKGDFFRKQSDDYLKEQRLVVKLANKTIEERISMGHSLEDMLLDCSWRGYPCSPANFTKIFDPQYGNCYVFNSGRGEDTLTTNRPGPNYGLSLQLFVQQDEYLKDLTDVAGFRVVIHHHSTMPFPEDDGIFVSPGLVTAVGVRVLEVERLPHPYGSCRKDVDRNIHDDIYHQNYNVSYSVQTCEQTCYQRAVIRDCGCSDPSFPSPLDLNVTIYPCDIDSNEEKSCRASIEQKYNHGILGCQCETACHDITYLPTISSAIWPSNSYETKLFDKMVRSNEEMRRQVRGQSPSDWTRSNMAKLEIYFDEFNYENVKQSPAYTIFDLLSDIGGQLGLWLGLSVITIFEIIESVWAIVSFFCAGRRNKTRPMTSIPTSKDKEPITTTPPPAYHHYTNFPDKKK